MHLHPLNPPLWRITSTVSGLVATQIMASTDETFLPCGSPYRSSHWIGRSTSGFHPCCCHQGGRQLVSSRSGLPQWSTWSTVYSKQCVISFNDTLDHTTNTSSLEWSVVDMVVGKSLNITGIDCFMPAFFPYFLLFCYAYYGKRSLWEGCIPNCFVIISTLFRYFFRSAIPTLYYIFIIS